MKTFLPADILLPKGVEMEKWSVVACDQYTSDRAYWRQTEETVGDAPSALRLILPEVYLGDGDTKERTAAINKAMRSYLDEGLFETLENSFIYTERTLSDGSVRHGLVGMLDLDDYDYRKGSRTPIRATEGTVAERIPPRVAIRKDAPLEIPHIMILIDDPTDSVIGPLKTASLPVLYDFDLMQGGGHIKGRRVTGQNAQAVSDALDVLAAPDVFHDKYGVDGQEPLVFAVGDGNHSLATAKACREQFGAGRYALAEIVNLHDASLVFEPIHRAVFHADVTDVLLAMTSFFDDIAVTDKQTDRADVQRFVMRTRDAEKTVEIGHPLHNLAVGSLQAFLDRYTKEKGLTVDYIHDEDALDGLLAEHADTVGFLLPPMPKSELFRTVILDGALPRKTFSMGHAYDKRYYLECRKTDK